MTLKGCCIEPKYLHLALMKCTLKFLHWYFKANRTSYCWNYSAWRWLPPQCLVAWSQTNYSNNASVGKINTLARKLSKNRSGQYFTIQAFLFSYIIFLMNIYSISHESSMWKGAAPKDTSSFSQRPVTFHSGNAMRYFTILVAFLIMAMFCPILNVGWT